MRKKYNSFNKGECIWNNKDLIKLEKKNTLENN